MFWLMVTIVMTQLKNKVITLDLIRSAGGCAWGARHFFNRYQLDFKSFLKNGVSAETLINTGDALAIDIVNQIIKGEQDGE